MKSTSHTTKTFSRFKVNMSCKYRQCFNRTQNISTLKVVCHDTWDKKDIFKAGHSDYFNL